MNKSSKNAIRIIAVIFLIIFSVLALSAIKGLRIAKDLKQAEKSRINGDFVQALFYIDRVIEKKPNFAKAYFFRCDLIEIIKAHKDILASPSMSEEDKSAFKQRYILPDDESLQKYDAISDYSKVIELEPDNLKAYEKRAEIYERKGKLKE